MTHLFRELRRREARGEPVRTAVIGAGFMGKGLVYQLSKMPGMRPALVVNRTPEKADRGVRGVRVQARARSWSATTRKALAVAVMEKRPAVATHRRSRGSCDAGRGDRGDGRGGAGAREALACIREQEAFHLAERRDGRDAGVLA